MIAFLRRLARRPRVAEKVGPVALRSDDGDVEYRLVWLVEADR